MKSEMVVAPGWVYSLLDYQQMFDLQEKDLNLSILDCPGGISSFNKEMRDLGHQVVSGDPLYHFSAAKMQEYANTIFHDHEAHLKAHPGKLKNQQEVDDIVARWHESEQMFLQDYEMGKDEQRYQAIELPSLPFADQEFDLALCSDLLFHSAVNQAFSPEDLLNELCRVAEEVRVFPLMNDKGEMTDDLGRVMLVLQQENFGLEVREVPYRWVKGGNAMLRIWATKCAVSS